MNKIVVAKKVRLGKDGDAFKKDLVAQVERTNVKIDSDYIEEFNQDWETTGRLFIIDKELTDKRNAEIAGVKVKPKKESPELLAAKEKYTELFGKAPHVASKLETILKKIKDKEKELTDNK